MVTDDPCVTECQGDLREMIQRRNAIVRTVDDAYRAVDLGRLQTQVVRPILLGGRRVFSAE